MNCQIPVVPILPQDCLGDSLAKINYNAVLLDTKLCNLSSAFFNNVINLDTIFTDLSALNKAYDNLGQYDTQKLDSMSIAATTVAQLSAFWDRNTFSVVYPVNGSILNDNSKVNVISSLDSSDQAITNMVNKMLKNLAKNYLTIKFRPQNYQENTVININFLIYNIAPTKSDNLTNSHLVKATYSKEFSYLNRKMYVSFSRDTINLTRSVILGFINKNNTWTFVGSLI